jgi:hypothetical protein
VLGEDGKAKIEIDVALDDAKWLRTSSVFTIEHSLVGGAKIRAYSGNLQDPQLPNDAVRQALSGDTTQEMPRLVATAREILENVERLTDPGGAVHATFANLQKLSERMTGPHGMLGALLGSEEQIAKVIGTIERTNTLLLRSSGRRRASTRCLRTPTGAYWAMAASSTRRARSSCRPKALARRRARQHEEARRGACLMRRASARAPRPRLPTSGNCAPTSTRTCARFRGSSTR